MANVVQIVITVDNAQAQTAVKQTITSFDQLPQSIAANTAALQALTEKLDQTSAGLNRVGAAARTMGGHATTSLDGVRLLSQEFGLRLPRALESMLSRMPAVTAAISGFVGAFAGIAIAEVVYRAGEAIYNLYEKYISLNAAAVAYQKTVDQRKDQEFVNPHTIEDATARINEATNAARAFKDMGQQIHDSAWAEIFSGNAVQAAMGIGKLIEGRQVTDIGYKYQGQADTITPEMVSAQREITALQLKDAEASDKSLRGRQQINAELQRALQLHAQDRLYTNRLTAASGGKVATNAGLEKQQLEDEISRRESAAKLANFDREASEKTISLQNEARNAALQGNALYRAQELEAEDAIRRSVTGTQTQIDAVRARFHADEMKRLQEETDAVNKRAEAEHTAGLTGLAHIQAEAGSRIGEIGDRQKRGLYSDQQNGGDASALADKDRATATAEMYRKMAEEETQFREQLAAEDEHNAERTLNSLERIDHQTDVSIQKRADAFSKLTAGMDKTDPRSAAIEASLRSAMEDSNTRDDEDRAQRKMDIEQQINDRTLQMDREAAQAERRVRGEGLSGWVQNYRDSLAEIQAAQAANLGKIDAEQRKTGGDPAQYERQKVDADRTANAQIEQLNQQMRQQVAGTLQGAFDDPVRYIQNRMKQMFFEILADWLMQSAAFKNLFGHTMSGLKLGGQAGAGTIHQMGLSGAVNAAGAAATNGTIAQASIRPGVSSTSGAGSGIPALDNANAGTAGMGIPAIVSSATNLAGTGIAAARALAGGGEAASSVADSALMRSMNPESDAAAQAQTQAASQNLAASGQSAALAQGMGLVAAGVGAYTGTKGVIDAFESGKASGILSGAASGAAFGGSLGMLAGPLGGAIGLGVGAAGGAAAGLVGWASGEGNRLGAQKYFRDTLRPELDQMEETYMRGGGGDALSAIGQVNNTAAQGYFYMATKFGNSAAQWAKTAYLDKERERITGEIGRLAAAGRDYTARSASQFHSGGTIGGFGDLATSANEGFIHAMLNETVMNPSASSSHAPYLGAMNAGASPTEMAAMYLKTVSGGGSGSSGSGGDTHHHWSVNAVDASSFQSFLRNGGGMDAIARETTKRNTRYAGDAD